MVSTCMQRCPWGPAVGRGLALVAAMAAVAAVVRMMRHFKC